MRKGLRELWSYSTTTEDNLVAKTVKSTLGDVEGLEALRLAYPGATIVKEFEQRSRNLSSQGDDFVTDQKQGQILDQFANEIIINIRHLFGEARPGLMKIEGTFKSRY